DYRRSPGICIHCSLGCHTTVSERYRQIVRMEGRHSDDVNGPFICDRGRYGFYYANRSDRPRKGVIDGKTVAPLQAAETAAERLAAISGKKGAAAVGVVGSARSSLQTQAALGQLCRQEGWQSPVFWDRKLLADNAKVAVSSLTPETAVSMRQIHMADFILTVGADPVNEAPMLTLAMRQAWREGAQVAAIDCRPLDWPFSFDQLTCRPGEMAEMLDQIISKISRPDPSPTATESRTAAVIAALQKAEWPVVVCGTEITDPAAVAKAAELTRVLQENDKPAGLFYILPQANSFGAALLDSNGDTAGDMVQKIENGTVSALVVVESDLWEQFPDRPRLEKALKKLDLLVAADFVDTEMVRRADIVIPTQTLFEAGGVYVNQEGRAQQAVSVFPGGLPIEITGGGDHPPRTFGPEIPGADIESAWQAAWRLAGREPIASKEQMLEWMMESYPVLAPLQHMTDEGIRLLLPQNRQPETGRRAGHIPDGALEILPAGATFGDESLSRHSECLQTFQTFAKPAEAWISVSDAESLSIAEGDTLELPFAQSAAALTARISDKVAPGVLVIYRQPDLFWQQFADGGRFYIDKTELGYPENSKF
ncbi:MAG: molybdopterin-dependent oxidoreductase, partial [Thermodesulfobacteriota bacterium]